MAPTSADAYRAAADPEVNRHDPDSRSPRHRQDRRSPAQRNDPGRLAPRRPPGHHPPPRARRRTPHPLRRRPRHQRRGRQAAPTPSSSPSSRRTWARLLDELAPHVTADRLVISAAAGITTSFIEERLADGTPVVRVMPNTPVLVDEGMSVISAGSHATAAHLAHAEEIFGAVGKTLRVPESQQDACTALSGSGPGVLLLPGRGDDRRRHPARPAPRQGPRPDRPGRHRRRGDAPRQRRTPGQAPRDRHLPGRHHHQRHPRTREPRRTSRPHRRPRSRPRPQPRTGLRQQG